MTRDIGILTGEVLVFGGVYSNLQALEAVRGFAERRGIAAGNVVCTGDIVGYCADPTPCVELVREWGVHAIAGNVEMNLRDGLEDCGCNFDADSRCDLFSRIWYPYSRRETSAAAVAWMGELPEYLTFALAPAGEPSPPSRTDSEVGEEIDTSLDSIPGEATVRARARRVHVLHGNHGATSEFVWRSSDWATTKAAAFAKTGSDVIVAGHSGLPFAHEEAGRLWLNAGALGMPANDGTPRVWCATVEADPDGEVRYAFHPLSYDHDEARRRMLAQPLPKSYALTLANGLWDNTEVMNASEASWTGHALDPEHLKRTAAGAPPIPPRADPNPKRMDKQYFDPKDLKKFGRISEHQPEMGRQFFDWYENATYGDTALTQREKALIALAVSHAIRCPYCVDAFTTNCLESGADEEQMMEAVHVAAAIQSGSTLISSVQMIKQAEKLGM